jgi:uncharacterized BrkB/YihY/UPF0761 family membrane protein
MRLYEMACVFVDLLVRLYFEVKIARFNFYMSTYGALGSVVG